MFKRREAAYETVWKSKHLFYSHRFGSVYIREDISRDEREKAWNKRKRNTSGESTATAPTAVVAVSTEETPTPMEAVAPAANGAMTAASATTALGEITQLPESGSTGVAQRDEVAQVVEANSVSSIEGTEDSSTGRINRNQRTTTNSGNGLQEDQREED